MPSGTLASSVDRQTNSSDGGERYEHSQQDAKVAEIRVTAARIAQAEGPERPEARC